MKESCILSPVSPGERSAEGLIYALKLAKAKNSELDILFITKDMNEILEIPHSELLKKTAGSFTNYRKVIRKGEPTDQILRTIEELEPEMIVLSPDVYKKGKKYFDESVAGKIIHNSIIPVLLIPEEADFKTIEHVVIGTELRENVVRSILELVKLFGVLNPLIHILVFADKETSWHFREDVVSLIHQLKDVTGYSSIEGNICDHENPCMGIDIFCETVSADLVCMERGSSLYTDLFFRCDTSGLSYVVHTPVLILPAHSEDAH